MKVYPTKGKNVFSLRAEVFLKLVKVVEIEAAAQKK